MHFWILELQQRLIGEVFDKNLKIGLRWIEILTMFIFLDVKSGWDIEN